MSVNLSSRTSIRLLHSLMKRSSVYTGILHHGLTTSSQLSTDKIIVPNRIPRSSTAILEALASTVSRDTSGPHYKYHDDPYLTPASNLVKRTFSLSKEAGRKAARCIRDENASLFTHRPDDPFIEDFFPKTSYTEESNVSEETLHDLIQKCSVSDAITVYHICKSKAVELSDKVRQELLELVSYYNCEDPLDKDWVEERWYRQGVLTVRKTWKDNGLAEELFESLSNRGPAAYSALIRGMAQYLQVDRAWQLYQECREKDIPLDAHTYNSLIRVASYLRDAFELRWQLVKELLTTMAESGIDPNLGTLNSTLEALGQVASWRQARQISLQVLAEFNSLGIQPSLASYYYLLTIHCRERGPISHILIDILDHIEGKEFSVEDPKDTFFFVTAMGISRNHVQSLDVARRVDDLLHTGSNYDLIGDSYKESIYYRHYFGLACSSLTIDDFMLLYQELVPHIYTPEPGVMGEVLRSVGVQEAFEYLPQLWSDMIVFDHTNQERLVTLVLSALSKYRPSQEQEQLTRQLADIAWDIWTRVQGQDETRRQKVSWTGQMIGDLITTLVYCGEYGKASEVMKEANTNAHNVLGAIPITSLHTLNEVAVDKKDADIAVSIVIYALDAGHQEAGEMAKQLQSKLTLSTQNRAKLSSVFGSELLSSP
ncbi:protein PTCD3 homolog, mitochondrial-like isoform X2 [Homarus americanus]|uniref:protein PTCD3 homolog, mitochondrial-like isoform X2 n=1 Tax=Homarus americanus TaxID=6706 RepID=UPI001C49422B|nr:protein PTCD3 homolog, mitochondrial-like isoform X2 [Homarus americanus]